MTAIYKTTLGALSLALMAGTAQAGVTQAEMDKKADETLVTTTQTVQTLDADGQVGQLTIVEVERNPELTAVLGALELQNTEAYIVQDNDGDLFINHLVPVEDLQDPTLVVDTVDTYEITYRGMTFTNKIVAEQ
jgi:methionyl-tRNA formyltransferase